MSKRTQGIVGIVVGVVVVIVSLAADALGIGGAAGIGWKQALGTLVGVIVVGVGAWYWPGFPQSRMVADSAGPVVAAPQVARKRVAPVAPRKRPVAEKASRPARKNTARSAKRRAKR
jgi:hypothetical protein